MQHPAILSSLRAILQDDEIILPDSPLYAAESTMFSASRNKHPALVVRPQTLQSLSATLVLLANSTVDFAIRGHGYGNGSATDVVLTTTAFDDFAFDAANKVVLLGAGNSWGAYYDKMEAAAPDYTVVAPRTPDVGVGGSIIHGGLSWLSGEFGCLSDPANMLDAQVVKLDGEVVWASTEPELLWALRGGGYGFGVVTQFKLRAYRYPRDIWAGTIMMPDRALPEVARAFAKFAASKAHPKTSLFLFKLKKQMIDMVEAEGDMLVIHVFDALGEAHGRSEAGFKWALDLPGAVDRTVVTNIRGVANLQVRISNFKGKYSMLWNPRLLPESAMTEETILKAFEWFDEVDSVGGSVANTSMLVLELFAFAGLCGREETAWPHPHGYKHILLTATGYEGPAASADAETALRLISKAADDVGIAAESAVLPNTTEDFHDIAQIYGENFAKLKAIKQKYDPKNRLQGQIHA